MNEDIRAKIALLNAVWQRYARTAEEIVDPLAAETVNRDYLAAWEELEACGIVESMLVYDPETLTFSLPTTKEGSERSSVPNHGSQKPMAQR